MTEMNESFTLTISSDKSPKAVYDAIKDVKSWWVGEVEGNADHVGSIFSYRYKEFHFSRQRVTELIPDQKIVWLVESAHIGFTQNKEEWKGTEIIFDISQRDGQTFIKFTHKGLTPRFECYEACTGGWDFYVTKSLQNFLATGKGLDPGF